MSGVIQTLLAVARRPWLYGTALRQWRALTPSAPWRGWPPAFGPSREYLRFRMLTMYGSPDVKPSPDELVRYLEWCRWMQAQPR